MEEQDKTQRNTFYTDPSNASKRFEDVDTEFLSEEDKKLIEDTVSQVAEEHEESLRLLARE